MRQDIDNRMCIYVALCVLIADERIELGIGEPGEILLISTTIFARERFTLDDGQRGPDRGSLLASFQPRQPKPLRPPGRDQRVAGFQLDWQRDHELRSTIGHRPSSLRSTSAGGVISLIILAGFLTEVRSATPVTSCGERGLRLRRGLLHRARPGERPGLGEDCLASSILLGPGDASSAASNKA